MTTFDESHGLGRIRDPFDSANDHKTGDWSKQRISIGVATERNLLELTEYKVLLRELGLHEIFETAREAARNGAGAVTAARYLTEALGFEWRVTRNAADELTGETP